MALTKDNPRIRTTVLYTQWVMSPSEAKEEGTPRLDQLEMAQAQPKCITWSLGSEHTLLFTLQEQHKVKLRPLFLIFLLIEVYLHPELPWCLQLGWGEMPLV